MARTRLYVDKTLAGSTTIELDAEQSRYIGRVLRLKAGDSISVFNGDNGEFSATVDGISKHSASLSLDASLPTTTESPFNIHLVQGVSRGERMDFVVQKATELGVKRITPVLTEYAVVRLSAERADRRQQHWQAVANSACEQSGRVRPPMIEAPLRLNDWFGIARSGNDGDFILRPDAAANLSSMARPASKCCLLVGPEGGFSDSEYADAEIAGFRAVSLGPRVLRTETAAMAAVTLTQALWGDLDSQPSD